MIADDLVYYISGPMTGIDDYNFPAFERVTQALRKQGKTVVSPHEVQHDDHGIPGSLHRTEYLRGDLLAMLKECNAIVVLPGWLASWGAKLEIHVAEMLEFKAFIFDESEGILVPVPGFSAAG